MKKDNGLFVISLLALVSIAVAIALGIGAFTAPAVDYSINEEFWETTETTVGETTEQPVTASTVQVEPITEVLPETPTLLGIPATYEYSVFFALIGVLSLGIVYTHPNYNNDTA